MDPSSDELAAMVTELRQRVRARNPNGAVSGDVALPDLTSLVRARDAAEAKVASIGTVNPRRPGLVNSIAQRVKKLVARVLDWHVREQVEFNRAAMACVQSTLDALAESNRAMAAMSASITARIDQLAQSYAHSMQELRDETTQLKDIRAHWAQWRVEWEQKLSQNEIHFLRGVADLQSSFQHRVTLMDANYRDQLKAQHADFEGALARGGDRIQEKLWADMAEFQKRFWSDLERMRADYDATIHAELRILRQRSSIARHTEEIVRAAPAEFADIDWLRFADRFRGPEESIRDRQQMYSARFQGFAPVLDIGCGRGEMLEVFREAGIHARGIDLNDDSVALAKNKGLDVEKADLFTYLSAQPDASLGGVVSCQVVEHLPPDRLAQMIRLASAKLRPGGFIAIETPNPECLAIFATHFYLDPTHRHPIPSALMGFYLEEAGFGGIEVVKLSPAVESIASVADLPERFREEFFGAMDYAVFARKAG